LLRGLKNYLLKAGPESLALRLSFRLQAAMAGIWMHNSGGKISLTKGKREIILGVRDIFLVPFAVHLWNQHFDTLEAQTRNGREVLDFSEPAIHRFRKSGLAFHFPSFAEEDAMDAYTAAYTPKAGDVVWDAGANAGTTAYSLAQMVGPTGKVYAFEPDDTNYEFLLRNMELHKVTNVVPIKAALSGKTGTALFCMDGTICAGLSDAVWFTASKRNVEVETLTFKDACDKLGSVPNYVNESNHIVGGELTSAPLDLIFGKAGYRAWSSDEFGQRFTWAVPPQ
jgi:FkbM family methyltransferase